MPIKYKGSVAVEFALVIGVLLLITVGIFEIGRAYWYYNTLAKATRDAARILSITSRDRLGDVADDVEQNLVVAAANASRIPGFTSGQVEATCGGGACQNHMALDTDDVVRVSVSYPLTIGGILPFILPMGGATTNYSTTLSPYTEMRYMDEGS